MRPNKVMFNSYWNQIVQIQAILNVSFHCCIRCHNGLALFICPCFHPYQGRVEALTPISFPWSIHIVFSRKPRLQMSYCTANMQFDLRRLCLILVARRCRWAYGGVCVGALPAYFRLPKGMVTLSMTRGLVKPPTLPISPRSPTFTSPKLTSAGGNPSGAATSRR